MFVRKIQISDQNSVNKEIIYKTTLILLAVAINAFEFFIPRIPFFPWLKPGLANCVTIIWIVEFGIVDALLFSLLRIWITGFYFGFSFYTISLSLSGGICSALVMGIAWTIAGKRGWLGTIGMGIIGALVHNLTQITVIYFLLAKNVHLFYQIPLMLAAAIIFGSLTGGIAPILLNMFNGAQVKIPYGKRPEDVSGVRVRKRDSTTALAIFAAGCVVALINDAAVLALCALFATIFVQLIHRGSIKLLLLPVTRFWMMFLFIACVHGFLSYGTKIEAVPFLTYEGVRLTGIQWLKLWTWLNLSFALTHFNFHHIVLKLLQRLFPANRTALFAGVLALQYFPAIVGAVQRKAKSRLSWCVRHPVMGTRKVLAFICREIERELSE